MGDLQDDLQALEATLESLTPEELQELRVLADLGRATDQATGARKVED